MGDRKEETAFEVRERNHKMSGEQKIRAVLFYLSVCIFVSGLPFILSFALGYKFDRRSFKFTKTGLIVLKTQPPGANVYFNKTLLNDKTPTSINELLPGKYMIELTLEAHYPYSAEIQVDAGKVVRLEKVILFPLRSDVKKINKEVISLFWVDETKGAIYYVNEEDRGLYKSDLDGDHFEKISQFLAIYPAAKKWKFSPDKGKLCYFNVHQIGILNLESNKELLSGGDALIINYPGDAITDVFWHSDSFHLVIVSAAKVEILEAKTDSKPVTLLAINKRNTYSFYDAKTDVLYFLDSQKAADGKFYDNLYKLELNTKLYPLKDLIKLAPAFEKTEVTSHE